MTIPKLSFNQLDDTVREIVRQVDTRIVVDSIQVDGESKVRVRAYIMANEVRSAIEQNVRGWMIKNDSRLLIV